MRQGANTAAGGPILPTIHQLLDQLLHDDPKEFVRLIAEMVARLENPYLFRPIAAYCTSWPLNVPAYRPRRRRKTKPQESEQEEEHSKAPKKTVWKPPTRQQRCDFVMDELLQVGSRSDFELTPGSQPQMHAAPTALAHDMAHIMTGLRSVSHLDQSIALAMNVLPRTRLEDGSFAFEEEEGEELAGRFNSWAQKVRALPPFTNAQQAWQEAAWEGLLIQHRDNVVQDPLVQEWLANTLPYESEASASSASYRMTANFESTFRNRFNQAFQNQIRSQS